MRSNIGVLQGDRIQKQEARSKKDGLLRCLLAFWLLTIVSGPFWLLASLLIV
jgi:hypothetical protein